MVTPLKYACLIGVVLSISCGQILFKYSADMSKNFSSIFGLFFYPPFIAAIALYGVTTFLWVWLLQQFELARAYPFFALSFTFVPLLSWIFFKEALDLRYVFSVLLICGGILLSVTR